jgi:hypothetical protein
MTRESLLAAALWLDELEAQRDAAVGQKWAALGEEFDQTDDGAVSAYQTRDAELDKVLVQPFRARLLKARKLLEERAAALAPRESWPAGGSWPSRAYALAKSGADFDARVVAAELATLRAAG